MLDNTLIPLIIKAIIAGEAAARISGTPVAAAFQPDLQGVNSQPTAYIYKIGDERIGFVGRTDVWDRTNRMMVHTEAQQYTTTFQISALAQQNPATPTQYTASDILNLIASILQSSVTIAMLESQDVGVLHIGTIRNPYFTDDYQRNEAAPNMDVIFCHQQVIKTQSPIMSRYELRILEI